MPKAEARPTAGKTNRLLRQTTVARSGKDERGSQRIQETDTDSLQGGSILETLPPSNDSQSPSLATEIQSTVAPQPDVDTDSRFEDSIPEMLPPLDAFHPNFLPEKVEATLRLWTTLVEELTGQSSEASLPSTSFGDAGTYNNAGTFSDDNPWMLDFGNGIVCHDSRVFDENGVDMRSAPPGSGFDGVVYPNAIPDQNYQSLVGEVHSPPVCGEYMDEHAADIPAGGYPDLATRTDVEALSTNNGSPYRGSADQSYDSRPQNTTFKSQGLRSFHYTNQAPVGSAAAYSHVEFSGNAYAMQATAQAVQRGDHVGDNHAELHLNESNKVKSARPSRSRKAVASSSSTTSSKGQLPAIKEIFNFVPFATDPDPNPAPPPPPPGRSKKNMPKTTLAADHQLIDFYTTVANRPGVDTDWSTAMTLCVAGAEAIIKNARKEVLAKEYNEITLRIMWPGYETRAVLIPLQGSDGPIMRYELARIVSKHYKEFFQQIMHTNTVGTDPKWIIGPGAVTFERLHLSNIWRKNGVWYPSVRLHQLI
ncbi:hypothetical protein C8R43DRAFT_305239 [Mycena crocata]|nr:hypothetical protein C8R43DRAFT_305239 [Mycena crocata]